MDGAERPEASEVAGKFSGPPAWAGVTGSASWVRSGGCWSGSSFNATEAANPIAVMIANSVTEAAAARQAVPNMKSVVAWPISDWSRSASPSMTTNATIAVQKPRRTNLPRMRRAGEEVLTV
jgi:hypothetical protein